MTSATSSRSDRRGAVRSVRSRAKHFSLWSASLWESIPQIYLVVALIGGTVMLLTQPIGQTPDAYYHLYRAAQIANGEPFSHFVGKNESGGSIPSGFTQIPFYLVNVTEHPLIAHVTHAILSALGRTPANSPSVTVVSSPSAIYPPFFYLPQAIGIDIARWSGSSVLWAYQIAVALNGLASSAISYLALRWSRAGRNLLFIVVSLPMTVSEYFSISQDALMISTAALAFALLSKNLASPPADKRAYRKAVWGSTALLLAINLARPVYLPLMVLPLFITPPILESSDRHTISGRRARLRMLISTRSQAILALVLALVIEGAWIAYDAATAYVYLAGPHVNAAKQLVLIFTKPLRDLSIVVDTFSQQGQFYLQSLEGYLGWLKVQLPLWAYVALTVGLIWALLVGDPPSTGRDASADNFLRQRRSRSLPGVALFLVALSFAFICGAELLTWSPLGSLVVDGVQGRYFLPLLPFLAFVRPPRKKPWRGAVVALSPIVPVVLVASTFAAGTGMLALYYISNR